MEYEPSHSGALSRFIISIPMHDYSATANLPEELAFAAFVNVNAAE